MCACFITFFFFRSSWLTLGDLPSAPILAQGMNFTFHTGAGQNGLFPRMGASEISAQYLPDFTH
jgi:hypothetical protein